ncbi:MAG: DUF448 domain-containing protein [Proteobacteria bacterium]|nr:DUF448 domain-containing protein [Pseudomonadota bacterium]MBU1685981.1 DUF448 domain-containing protein [Pseudomonadota bacterium]
MVTTKNKDDGHVGTLRTCLGCGKKDTRGELYRFAVIDARLCHDDRKILPGRGVYCCREQGCLNRLLKNTKKVKRALRRDLLDLSGIEGLTVTR